MYLISICCIQDSKNSYRKDKEMEKITIEKNVYELLQEVRYELTKVEINKSGFNKHLNFNYFELKDFLPTATKLFAERNLTPVFNIEVDNNGIEYAYLEIIKGAEKIMFKVPTANAQNNNPIQGLGSKITYLRRYLYLIALDLVENDIVDAENPDEKKVKFASKVQVDKILTNGKLIGDTLKELGVKTKNDVESLTMDKASELCAEIDKILKEKTNDKETS